MVLGLAAMLLVTSPTVITVGPIGSGKPPLTAATLARADEVIVLPGDYALPEGLLIEGRTRPLLVRAQKPGSVRLIGGSPLRAVPSGRFLRFETPARFLLENGLPMTLARTPNEGYLRAEDPGTDPATQFRVGTAVAPLLTGDLRYLEVFSWPGWDWFSNRGPVTGWDPASRTLTTSALPGYAYRRGNRFRLEGDVRFLDQAGEFARTEGALLALPTVRSARYESFTAPVLVRIRASQGVTLQGLDLIAAVGDVVRIEDSVGTRVRECLVRGGGETGIKSVGKSADGEFVGNLIELNGQHGIDFEGPSRPTAFSNGRNLVLSNRVRQNGRRFGNGYGISMHSSGFNRILRNHITDQPRYGISFKGDGPADPGGDGRLREYRPGEYRPTQNNLVEGNRIERVNLDSEDTGAIEAWNPGRDNRIIGNWIGPSGDGTHPIMSGLYLDDGADGFTVRQNVIFSGSGSADNQAIFTKGIDNLIEGNLLVVQKDAKAAIASMEMAGLAARRHVYRNNAVYFEPRPVAPPRSGRNPRPATGLQDVGTTLTMPFHSPRSGRATVWVRYASRSADFGVPTMSGQSTLSVGGPTVSLAGFSNTRTWDDYAWTEGPAATLQIEEGDRKLVWKNVKGGGINLDVFLLDFTGRWKPGDATDLPGLILVFPGSTEFPERFSTLHWLVNDGPERIRQSEGNILLGDTRELFVQVGGKFVPLEEWRTRGLDRTTRIGDPGFVNPARFDFRLRPNAPKSRFDPLPLSQMGLGNEYPARFPR